jgi:hypothetical protein
MQNRIHSFQRQQREVQNQILISSAKNYDKNTTQKKNQATKGALPGKHSTDQNDVMENSRFHWSPHAVAEDVIHDNRSSGCCSNSAYVVTGIASSFFVPIGIGQGLQPLVYFVAWNCVLGRTKFEMS